MMQFCLQGACLWLMCLMVTVSAFSLFKLVSCTWFPSVILKLVGFMTSREEYKPQVENILVLLCLTNSYFSVLLDCCNVMLY